MSWVANAARAGGWRDWSGRGARPVSANTPVSILCRDGSAATGIAGEWEWGYLDMPDYWEPDDIVSYKAMAGVFYLPLPAVVAPRADHRRVAVARQSGEAADFVTARFLRTVGGSRQGGLQRLLS